MCFAQCTWEEELPELRDLFSSAEEVSRSLFQKGSPLEGPLRIAVVPLDFPKWSHGFALWPLETAMQVYVRPFAVLAPGTGGIVGADHAGELRALRSLQRVETFALRNSSQGAIPIKESDGDGLHGLYMRDVLPIEDAMGRLP